jgi:hypothetical protein
MTVQGHFEQKQSPRDGLRYYEGIYYAACKSMHMFSSETGRLRADERD